MNIRVERSVGILVACLATVSVACSSTSNDPVDAGSTPDANVFVGSGCIMPGDKGNSLKVGQFCTQSGGECDLNTGNGEAYLCTVDQEHGAALPMCTKACFLNSECGEGAICTDGEPAHKCSHGKGCVPKRCTDNDPGLVARSECETDGGPGDGG